MFIKVLFGILYVLGKILFFYILGRVMKRSITLALGSVLLTATIFVLIFAYRNNMPKLKDAPINVLPDKSMYDIVSFQGDTVWSYSLNSLPGAILSKMPAGSWEVTHYRLLAKDSNLKIDPIPDGKRYYSTVNNKFDMTGLFSILSGALNSNEVGELNISDIAVCMTDSNFPNEDIVKLNKAKPPVPGEQRYWIKGVLLSYATLKIFKEYINEANASISIMKADGKFYASTDNYKRYPLLSFALVNITGLNDVSTNIFHKYILFADASNSKTDINDPVSQKKVVINPDLRNRIFSIDRSVSPEIKSGIVIKKLKKNDSLDEVIMKENNPETIK